jgi:hypothetical protein
MFAFFLLSFFIDYYSFFMLLLRLRRLIEDHDFFAFMIIPSCNIHAIFPECLVCLEDMTTLFIYLYMLLVDFYLSNASFGSCINDKHT